MPVKYGLLYGAVALYISANAAPSITQLPGMKPVFEENGGQADSSVLFLARDARGTLTVTRNGARVSLVKRDRNKTPVVVDVDVRFPRANFARVRGEKKLASYTNLLLGSNPGQSGRQVPHYSGVRVEEAYPGIDIVFHARRGVVEFDFEVAPGANVRLPRFTFPGRVPQLLPDGSLRVSTAAGDLALPRPVAYQDGDQIVDSRFELAGGEARFSIGAYDRTRKLTIDPVLTYLTYLGGSGPELPAAIAVDAAGNIFVAGSTGSSAFPVTNGVLQMTAGGQLDAFVSKFSPAGVLLYSTLIGGRDQDLINDIALDSQGSVYFCGATASDNFPLANAIQPANKGGTTGLDVMFGKLNPSGAALVYSTYYGGNYDDTATACTADADGNLYVTGRTVSENFPFTPGVFQTSNRSLYAGNGFVTKIAPAGDKAVFSTFLGGGADELLYDIKLDKTRNIYVVGTSVSSNYPVVGAYQPTNRGNQDAVLTKLNAAGTGILFSTFLGSSGVDSAYGLEVDADNNVYVVGVTSSSTFPVAANALKKELQGPTDTFIMKFDASGATLLASTLFGGSRTDEPFGIALDRAGSLYVAGTTASPGLTPVDAIQPVIGGGMDAFVLKMSPAIDRVEMFTYLGGSSDDLGVTLALDGAGRVIVTGVAISTNLQVTQTAAQRLHGGSSDGFLAIIDSSTAANPLTVSVPRLTFTGGPGGAVPRQQFTIRATAGVPEWTIEATTATGGAWLTATPLSGVGNATIDVAVNTASLAPGAYQGTITVNNKRLGTQTPIPVSLTVQQAGGTVPENGVVSAATFSQGAVAPGLLVTIFGSGIGPASLTTAQLTPQGTLATALAETRVLFDGTAAPLVYVSAKQLSAIVPYGVAGKTTTAMQVEYRGAKSNAVNLRVTEAVPGLFTANSSGKGPGAILNEDNSLNTAGNPARTGAIVILYGTGEGITDPGGQDGQLATSIYPKPRQPVTVRIGGKDADVLYAAAAPGLVAGVFQINVRVPEGLDAGPQPVVVQVGSASSSPEVTVEVQP